MIIDRIENAHLYYSLSPDIKACLSYLREMLSYGEKRGSGRRKIIVLTCRQF